MIGRRIKRMRKMRGMTMRELGISAGLNPQNADIRIAQYESGTRCPKTKLISSLANALGVSPKVMKDYDLRTKSGILCILYELEELYGVSFVEKDGRIFFGFNNPTKADSKIKDWTERRQQFLRGEISRDEYNDWRYNESLTGSCENE